MDKEPQVFADPLGEIQSRRPSGARTALRLAALVALLYIFVISITLLGDAFKLFGSGVSEALLDATSRPVVGLFVGILATAILQSSSTTTSLVVGLVGSGAIGMHAAVPVIMGANIGTSVTNTLVSLAHISRKDEFRVAFAGSVLHDFFNICAVLVLLPLEMAFGVISVSATAVEHLFAGFGGVELASPLAATTKPIAHALIELTGRSAWLSLLAAVILLFGSLRYIVAVLRTLVIARVEKFFQRYVFRTPWLGFLLGIGVTALVQSSSITTSLVIPLIGAGVITLAQIYPYLLGANLGTTITAFLASFVTGSHEAVAVAFAHLLFNAYGIAVFWPLGRIPMALATGLARWTQRSRLVPILYILLVFFLLPAIVVFGTR